MTVPPGLSRSKKAGTQHFAFFHGDQAVGCAGQEHRAGCHSAGKGADHRPAHLRHAVGFSLNNILFAVTCQKCQLGQHMPEEQVALSAHTANGQ